MITSIRHVAQAMPPDAKRLTKSLVQLPGWLANALNPAKFCRTVFYHVNGYRLLGVRVEGVHLGTGGIRIPSFLNLDADIGIPCDVTARSESIKLAPATVGTIYASHLLEHVSRRRITSVLADWCRVLRPGGKLYLCVPDLEVLANIYLDGIRHYDAPESRRRADLAVGIVYGGQVDSFDFHFFGYSFATLSALLREAGFSQVERFDRSKLDFAPFVDGGYAAIEGTSVSLNVVGTK